MCNDLHGVFLPEGHLERHSDVLWEYKEPAQTSEAYFEDLALLHTDLAIWKPHQLERPEPPMF